MATTAAAGRGGEPGDVAAIGIVVSALCVELRDWKGGPPTANLPEVFA